MHWRRPVWKKISESSRFRIDEAVTLIYANADWLFTGLGNVETPPFEFKSNTSRWNNDRKIANRVVFSESFIPKTVSTPLAYLISSLQLIRSVFWVWGNGECHWPNRERVSNFISFFIFFFFLTHWKDSGITRERRRNSSPGDSRSSRHPREFPPEQTVRISTCLRRAEERDRGIEREMFGGSRHGIPLSLESAFAHSRKRSRAEDREESRISRTISRNSPTNSISYPRCFFPAATNFHYVARATRRKNHKSTR